MKKILWLLIAVVVVGVIYMNVRKSAMTETDATSGDANQTIETAQPADGVGADMLTGMYGLSGVEWVFTPKTEGDGFHAPITTARVQPVGVTRPDGRKIEVSTWRLGDQQGTCSKIDKPADETVSALSYAQCWWAGGGNQFRAVRDGNILRVDVRGVDEEESVPATFKQLVVIDLAAIAK